MYLPGDERSKNQVSVYALQGLPGKMRRKGAQGLNGGPSLPYTRKKKMKLGVEVT